MGNNDTRILMQFAVLAMVLISPIMVKEVTSLTVCKIDTNDMQKCRPAVSGNNPPPPVNECCAMVKSADLACFCRYKFYLPILGIDPSKIAALVAKCGVTAIPRNCRA
ncbi:Bifunctional inhibitor/plant lipid transfer protein/seed storage helical domain-containing protein [Hirschfeldia incana]|nr:Bifunctional inhibitor/plant lipid transfer protein/seed storage helical domain-containing protein [Hirschfeldia incana]